MKRSKFSDEELLSMFVTIHPNQKDIVRIIEEGRDQTVRYGINLAKGWV